MLIYSFESCDKEMCVDFIQHFLLMTILIRSTHTGGVLDLILFNEILKRSIGPVLLSNHHGLVQSYNTLQKYYRLYFFWIFSF